MSALLDKLVPIFPHLEVIRPSLHVLNAFAIDFRYPGESADKVVAVKAFRLGCDIRQILRERLGLDVAEQKKF